MDVILHKIQSKKAKFLLVFFSVLYFASCVSEQKPTQVELLYKDDKAISASFSKKAPNNELDVFVKGNSTAILGKFSSADNEHIFTPVIPFTNGQEYIIKHNGKLLAEFKVAAFKSSTPKLKAIYPSADSVPQNLLKMYFVFSEPMQEVGKAIDFITIYDNTSRENQQVFLELPSELWNKEHTRLTLWLDPGRIKTALIPNKKEGLPLKEGHHYTLTVAKNLKSAKGIVLDKTYTKNFVVIASDRKQPNSTLWSISAPTKGSRDKLEINFNEPMDAILALETISIQNNDNEIINGTFELKSQEQKLNLYPEKPWNKGSYEITILSILEDLAGNNLNHLFDSSVQKTSEEKETSETKTIKFVVK